MPENYAEFPKMEQGTIPPVSNKTSQLPKSENPYIFRPYEGKAVLNPKQEEQKNHPFCDGGNNRLWFGAILIISLLMANNRECLSQQYASYAQYAQQVQQAQNTQYNNNTQYNANVQYAATPQNGQQAVMIGTPGYSNGSSAVPAASHPALPTSERRSGSIMEPVPAAATAAPAAAAPYAAAPYIMTPARQVAMQTPAQQGIIREGNSGGTVVYNSPVGNAPAANPTLANAPTANVPTANAAPGETLEEAWTIALSNSRQLQARRFETNSATYKIEAAKGLRRPKVANSTALTSLDKQPMFHTDLDLGPFGSLGLDMPMMDKDFMSSVTSVTVPLYLGGRVHAMIQSASSLATALESGEKIEELDLKYKVAETYFLVLRVQQLLKVAQEAETTTASHEKDAQRLLSNGIVTKNVLLAAQVAHAEARQNVIKANNSLKLSEAAYNRLLWRSLDAPVLLQETDIPPVSTDLESLTATALRLRPELRALAAKSQALAAQSKVHRAARLPQVAIVGAHTYLEDKAINPNSNFSASLGMVWVPYDGGTSRAQQDSAMMEAQSAVKEREDAETGIQLQVYQCWLDEQNTRERVDVARTAVQQADENLRVVTRSFHEGLVNHTEVLDAQTLRTTAGVNYAHARYDAILATYHLHRAIGEF